MQTQHMPSANVDTSRWGSFTSDELDVIRYSLIANAEFLLEDIAAGEIHEGDVEAARKSAARADALADEIDDRRGK